MTRVRAVLWMLCFALAQAAMGQGRPARDFTLRDSDGGRVRLSDLLHDGPVLLDFWATWCAPCKLAMPRWVELGERYADHGLRFVAISQDDPRSQAKIVPYLRSQGFEFASLLDSDKRVGRLFHVRTLPTTLLLASTGEVFAHHVGYREGDEREMEAKIRELLGLPASEVEEGSPR